MLYWNLETDDFVFNSTQQAEAWRRSKWKARITWRYNWTVLKVSRWPTTSVLAMPTIIAMTDSTTIEEIVANNELVINWSTGTGDTVVNPENLVAYEWPTENLATLEWQKALLEWLQDAYSWTIMANEESIANILTADPTNNNEVSARLFFMYGEKLSINLKIFMTKFSS